MIEPSLQRVKREILCDFTFFSLQSQFNLHDELVTYHDAYDPGDKKRHGKRFVFLIRHNKFYTLNYTFQQQKYCDTIDLDEPRIKSGTQSLCIDITILLVSLYDILTSFNPFPF